MKKLFLLFTIGLYTTIACLAQSFTTSKLETSALTKQQVNDIRNFKIITSGESHTLPITIVSATNLEIAFIDNAIYSLSPNTKQDKNIIPSYPIDAPSRDVFSTKNNKHSMPTSPLATSHHPYFNTIEQGQLYTFHNINDDITSLNYPSPSLSTFFLNNLTGNSRIHVFDLTGKLVSNIETNDSSIQINLTDQNKGMYYVTIENEISSQSLHVLKV